MENKNDLKKKKMNIMTLALGIAILPPIWAVLSSHSGIEAGGVALVCAGVFVASGNKPKDGLKISLGFLIGLVWGILASYIINVSTINKDVTTFLTLFVFGGVAVLISSSKLEKYLYLPAWLSGWAITLGMLGGNPISEWGRLSVSIGISMVVGVVYVGIGVLKFQQLICKKNRLLKF